jgi:hypothetical protein
MPAMSATFSKLTFLHALADRAFGVAWYRAPGDEGCANGRHLEWRDEVAWRQPGDELHAGFATLPERSIATLKRATIWPKGTLFHREPMPSRMERSAWGTRQRRVLEGADIVFLDPDNGVGDEMKKHAAFSEIRLLRNRFTAAWDWSWGSSRCTLCHGICAARDRGKHAVVLGLHPHR